MVVIVFIIPFILYIITLAPTIVAVGDNAELITCSYILGIAHPPGYPLFNILGKLFTYLPFSNIGYRVNLMSAFFGSLCVLLIYLIVFILTKDKISGVISAFALGCSSLFWKYSILAEVFALNNLFVAILIFTLLIWKFKKNIKLLYLSSFIYGLGLTNHQTLIFLLPAILFFIFKEDKKLLNLKISLFIIPFLLGLSLYLYLPIRASNSPEINWFNPTNLENFKKVIFRTIYGKPNLNLYQLLYFKNSVFYNYFIKLIKDFYYIGFIFIFFGLNKLKRTKSIFWFLFIAFILTGPFFTLFLKYDNNPIYFDVVSRFYILSFTIISIIIGFGIFSLKEKLSQKFYNLIPLILIIPIITNLPKLDLHKNYFLYDFCKDTLHCIEKEKSILIVTGDATIMGFDYLQIVEQKSKEIKVFSLEKLSHAWYINEVRKHHKDVSFPFDRIAINETLEKFIEPNKNFKFFAMGLTKERLGENYKLINYGLVSEIVKKDTNLNILEYKSKINSLNQKLKIFDYKVCEGEPNFELELIDYIAKSKFSVGYFFHINNEFEYAIESYRESIGINPKFSSPYKNLGVLLYQLGRKEEAITYFEKYIKLTPIDDPERNIISNLIDKEKAK